LPPPVEGPTATFDELLDAALAVADKPTSFGAWVASLSHDTLLAVTRDYFSIKAAQEKWLASVAPRAPPLPASRKHHASIRYSVRLSVGVRYRHWLATEDGRLSRAPLRDFRGMYCWGLLPPGPVGFRLGPMQIPIQGECQHARKFVLAIGGVGHPIEATVFDRSLGAVFVLRLRAPTASPLVARTSS
jgi:hypothetical protein